MTSRLDLRLPADLKHNLALEAARDNRTISAVTVLAIREYLDKRDTKCSTIGTLKRGGIITSEKTEDIGLITTSKRKSSPPKPSIQTTTEERNEE